MKHRFLVSLIVGLLVLTGVAYATSNAAAHTAAIGFLCAILLKATEAAHFVYRILIGQ
jgi:amino acid permease